MPLLDSCTQRQDLNPKLADPATRPTARKQLGVLLVSGLIVGEGLFGVAIAAVTVLSGDDAPLALVGGDFADKALWIGGIGYVVAIGGLYRWLGRMSDRVAA